jgi:quinohemoprotein ethanol dehydrogenase
MRRQILRIIRCAACAGVLGAPLHAAMVVAAPAPVIDDRALANEADGRNWAAYGRTYSETHYSPLAAIDTKSIKRLGLAFSLGLEPLNVLSTPLAVDGVIYLAVGYSIVHAVDARTGKLLWRYDPGVPERAGKKLRIGWGIRGLAYWKGRVFVGTHDGRLLAIDARTGKPVWTVQTIDPEDGAFISGPPRVFDDKVVIGFGGADFGPIRGYVTAYDTATGKQLWRFWTVPGDPSKGFENEAMEMAARTWSGEWWKVGGGGTVWNTMTYDPEFNRLYLGTGNGDPWNPRLRSPGGGDNLFLCSIVALDADTGEYVWHYQTVPGDAWDYNSAMDMELAELTIDGRQRKVLLHAPKNGFFYVIDREDGKLLSAEKLGKVTWAERVDLETGRPVLVPNARYEHGAIELYPSFQGVHNWFPMSFSPRTGLVYVPTIEMSIVYSDEGIDAKTWSPMLYTPEYVGLARGDGDPPADAGKSALIAWDPVAARKVWEVPTPGPHNGGTLATAGDVVFQGLADGYLHAYSAHDGKRLWSFFAGTAVVGTPITFEADGSQYIAILAGPLSGSAGGFGSMAAQFGWNAREHPRRLLAFKLDGKASLPPTPPPRRVEPLYAGDFALNNALVKTGVEQWARCELCHGPGAVAGGTAPDLRGSRIPLSRDAFDAIVRDGSLEARGMPRFGELTGRELEALRHYIRYRARLTAAPE